MFCSVFFLLFFSRKIDLPVRSFDRAASIRCRCVSLFSNAKSSMRLHFFSYSLIYSVFHRPYTERIEYRHTERGRHRGKRMKETVKKDEIAFHVHVLCSCFSGADACVIVQGSLILRVFV